jgi:hypothetical protein
MAFQNHSGALKSVALFLSVIMLVLVLVPDISIAQNCEEGVINGKADGSKGASPAWIIAGLGCGIFGLGAAFLIKPSAPASRLVGKSPEYVVCYTDAYKSAARDRQVIYATIGMAVWIIIYFAAIYPSENDD